MKYKISVIVPVYNTGKYLDKCISSIVNQDYKNLQLILIDDGSSDNSLEILKKWELKDDRILILSEKHKGVSHARNIGIKKAEGEFIAFIDSDDWVIDKYFSTLISDVKDSIDISAFCYFNNVLNEEEEKEIDIDNRKIEILSSSDALGIRNIMSFVTARIYRANLFKDILFNEKT